LHYTRPQYRYKGHEDEGKEKGKKGRDKGAGHEQKGSGKDKGDEGKGDKDKGKEKAKGKEQGNEQGNDNGDEDKGKEKDAGEGKDIEYKGNDKCHTGTGKEKPRCRRVWWPAAGPEQGHGEASVRHEGKGTGENKPVSAASDWLGPDVDVDLIEI
jgi:hypothetical protein